MIGQLRGTVVSKRAPWLLLDVGGVGYEVEVPASTFFELPAVGANALVITHLLVREDAQLLYGFATYAERDLFRLLLKVSGVGARVALAILSGISVEGFRRCVKFDDTKSLIKVPGIGRKTAERLVIEMRDKLDTDDTAPAASAAPGQHTGGAEGEAADALLALGYKPTEVSKLLAGIDSADLSTEDILRRALAQAVAQ